MKNKITTIILYSLIIVFIIPSCTILKRKYSRGYYIQWNSQHQKKYLNIAKQDTTLVSSEQIISNEINSNPINNDNTNFTASANNTLEIYINKKKSFLDDKCDVIILKTGDEIKGKVSEITLTEIKYKKCTNLEGPTISIDKKDVFMIQYANGTKDVINVDDESAKKKNEQSDYVNSNFSAKTEVTEKKTEGLSLAGFIISLVGLFGVGIVLGTLGVIFGIVGLNKINKYPEKYKSNKGFAIASIIIGAIGLLASIIIIALLA